MVPREDRQGQAPGLRITWVFSQLSGVILARREAVTQARRFGVEILTPQEVTGIRVKYRLSLAADGGEIKLSRANLGAWCIVATAEHTWASGARLERRLLNLADRSTRLSG